MSLNRSKVTPLGVLGLRQLSVIPEHFTTIVVNQYTDIASVNLWIVYNLNSRYAFRKKLILDNTNKMITVLEIGLEDPSEISMLTLGCPHLYTHKELF